MMNFVHTFLHTPYDSIKGICFIFRNKPTLIFVGKLINDP